MPQYENSIKHKRGKLLSTKYLNIVLRCKSHFLLSPYETNCIESNKALAISYITLYKFMIRHIYIYSPIKKKISHI